MSALQAADIGDAAVAKQLKTALRGCCIAKARAVPLAQRAKIDAQICAQLTAMPAYRHAEVVFCFVGTAHEIDTTVLLQKVLYDKKILCVPFCVPHQRGVLQAKRVHCLQDLQVGAFGIAAPPESADTVPVHAVQLIVLPCVAADATGVRLGYGGGYYDRYLAQYPAQCTSAVLCRSALRLPTGVIPTQPHDVRAQLVITEEEILCGDVVQKG